MKRVIITPPRYKGWGTNRSKGREAQRDPEDLPAKESMRKKHIVGWGGKEFSDFLTPLCRFLEKNVGRPWNKVYSEICEHADARSIDGWHLRQHVSLEVRQNVTAGEDNKIYGMYYYYQPLELNHDTLYVCPKTGLLKRYERAEGRWWRRRSNFSCLEEIVARHTPDIKHSRAPIKYCTLEYSNGTLWAVFWQEHNKFPSKHYATADHAYMFLENVRKYIRANLKTAISSRNPCIREMGRIVKAEEEHKVIELRRKDNRFNESLIKEKQQRKAEKANKRFKDKMTEIFKDKVA